MAERKSVPTYRHDGGIWTLSSGRRVQVTVTVKPTLVNGLVRRAIRKTHGRATMCGGAFAVQLTDVPTEAPHA